MLTKCMKQSRSKGFTLTEVVLAIGVVAVLIVVFMAMFIPARRTVQSALTIREADRIVHALTAELENSAIPSVPRPTPESLPPPNMFLLLTRRFTGCSSRPGPLRPFLFTITGRI